MRNLVLLFTLLVISQSCKNKITTKVNTATNNSIDTNSKEEFYINENKIAVYDTGYFFSAVNVRPSKDFLTWIERCKKDTNLVALDSSKVNMVDPLKALRFSYISCLPDAGEKAFEGLLSQVIEYAWNYSFYHKGIRKRIDIFELKMNREKLKRIQTNFERNGQLSDYVSLYVLPINMYNTAKSKGSTDIIAKVFECLKGLKEYNGKEIELQVLNLADDLNFED